MAGVAGSRATPAATPVRRAAALAVMAGPRRAVSTARAREPGGVRALRRVRVPAPLWWASPASAPPASCPCVQRCRSARHVDCCSRQTNARWASTVKRPAPACSRSRWPWVSCCRFRSSSCCASTPSRRTLGSSTTSEPVVQWLGWLERSRRSWSARDWLRRLDHRRSLPVEEVRLSSRTAIGTSWRFDSNNANDLLLIELRDADVSDGVDAAVQPRAAATVTAQLTSTRGSSRSWASRHNCQRCRSACSRTPCIRCR